MSEAFLSAGDASFYGALIVALGGLLNLWVLHEGYRRFAPILIAVATFIIAGGSCVALFAQASTQDSATKGAGLAGIAVVFIAAGVGLNYMRRRSVVEETLAHKRANEGPGRLLLLLYLLIIWRKAPALKVRVTGAGEQKGDQQNER